MTAFSELEPAPVPAMQSLVELGALWEHVASGWPHRVVEIGSLFGGTLWYWLMLPGLAELVSVDLLTEWEGPIPAGGRVYSLDDVRRARAEWPSWPHADRLRIVEGDSHDPATASHVAMGGLIDFLFIDGDHDDPALDFSMWSPLVRPGGIVALHDTVENRDRHEPAVVELCARLKRLFPSVEWFEPDGVGITAFTMP